MQASSHDCSRSHFILVKVGPFCVPTSGLQQKGHYQPLNLMEKIVVCTSSSGNFWYTLEYDLSKTQCGIHYGRLVKAMEYSLENGAAKQNLICQLRADNASVVDFLTSTVGVLHEKGLLNKKEIDNLRLNISGIQSDIEARQKPILLEMIAQDADVILLLQARFGFDGFFNNLFRHTVRSYLDEFRSVLSELGTNLAGKTDLLFNRVFYEYKDDVCVRHRLYSSMVMQVSESLAEVVGNLTNVLEKLSEMQPSDLSLKSEEEIAVDLAIADSLGFDRVKAYADLSHDQVEESIRVLAETLCRLSQIFSWMLNQMARNHHIKNKYVLLSHLDDLKSESRRLVDFSMPDHAESALFEIRRLSLTRCLTQIFYSMSELATVLDMSFSHPQQKGGFVFPKSLANRLISELISAGKPTKRSYAAVAALNDYMKKKDLSPDNLLLGEATKIHVDLMPRSISQLQEFYANRSLMSDARGEKDYVILRRKKISGYFSQFVHKTSLVFLGVVGAGLFISCGFKTNPTSDIIEFRPEIPYQARAPDSEPTPSVKETLSTPIKEDAIDESP
jgi:hypothetical protein